MEGHDPEERIVDIVASFRDPFVKVYYRNENDEKCVAERPFYPFVWAKKEVCVRMKKYITDNGICGGSMSRLMGKFGIFVKELSTKNNEGETVEDMENGYTYIFYATRPMSYGDFLKFFKEAGYPVYRDKKDNQGEELAKNKTKYYLTATPEEQYLISTGKRYFKGYNDYDQILRMIFDLETTGLDTKKDRIEQIGVRFNRPVKYRGKEYTFERVFSVEGETEEEKNASELEAIKNFLSCITLFKPDVITAHNGENFDWNMLIGALERLGTSMYELSKEYFNGEPIYKSQKENVLKLGGEVEKYRPTVVPHTIITDSLHAVRRAQAIDSSMKKADLKYATKYAKLVKKNRVYVPGDKISTVWNDNEPHYAFNDEDGKWYEITAKKPLKEGYEAVTGRYIVERYLLDDLWECDKVELKYNATNFLICKILPLPYQKCTTMGTAGQWKALLMAWSYENGLAIPDAPNTGKFTGGLSRLLRVGYVDNVIKLDYNSLYPSIILTWGIEDEKDLMGTMLKFLEYVLTTREQSKALKKKAGKVVEKYEKKIAKGQELTPEELQEYQDAQRDYAFNDGKQMQQKVLGNSFFGSYGSNIGSLFPWKSIVCAERTTCTGRQSLRLMISHFAALGYEPIVGDTDGFNFKLPDTYRYTEENPYISPGLSRETKKGKAYTGYEADVAEFNDLYMSDKHYADNAVNKMGLGIDEIVSSTINFSRKNYADHFPDKPYPEDVKMVGNTIKSKKMPEYIEKFLDKGIRLLLKNDGQGFLNEYYDYIDKIYSYRIPLKEIASRGKVKKSLSEYVTDCKSITKAGRPKSRQAWMELALKDGIEVNLGETLFYINTGKSKSQSDVKKVTHYYAEGGLFGDKMDMRVALEKEWKAAPKSKTVEDGVQLSLAEYVKKYHPEVTIEDEIILNAMLLPREMAESEKDIFCEDVPGMEYNVPKYISQFNNRIKPLLVCFSKDIRDKILINNPAERPYFTEDQSKLSSGEPNNLGDQDTYEQLMTMEDKEIKFWAAHPEFKIPFLDECGMNWEEIKKDYEDRIAREKQLGIDRVREAVETAIGKLSSEEFDAFEDDGEIPASLKKLVDFDPVTSNFVDKTYPDIVIMTIYDVLDARYAKETENGED